MQRMRQGPVCRHPRAVLQGEVQVQHGVCLASGFVAQPVKALQLAAGPSGMVAWADTGGVYCTCVQAGLKSTCACLLLLQMPKENCAVADRKGVCMEW